MLIDVLLRTRQGLYLAPRIFLAGKPLHAPHLMDLEIAQVLRRLVRGGSIDAARGTLALNQLTTMRVRRYPHLPLLPRIWALRDNVTAYDASYIALADFLGAVLFTRDARLARAAGHRVRIELIDDVEV